jgi:hypothetical protein
MTVLSIIPGLGGALVWVPATIILITTGRGLAEASSSLCSALSSSGRPRASKFGVTFTSARARVASPAALATSNRLSSYHLRK